MKYLILISANPEGRAMFGSMSHGQRVVAVAGYRRLNEDLTASGAKIASAALADPAEGTGVTVADGRIFTTDGPYAEAKEFCRASTSSTATASTRQSSTRVVSDDLGRTHR